MGGAKLEKWIFKILGYGGFKIEKVDF